ncbi:MAG TPA: phosphoribosylformylglycinamidine synthase subunit PurS [Rubricoccaceae bacterium]|jgi:phosphoribosylformylglycinamidine synthase
MYHVHVRILLRPSILDPQGQAVGRALHTLGLEAITTVRTGRFVELTLDTDDAAEAQRLADQACRTLLANPVTEDFEILAVLPTEGRHSESGVSA